MGILLVPSCSVCFSGKSPPGDPEGGGKRRGEETISVSPEELWDARGGGSRRKKGKGGGDPDTREGTPSAEVRRDGEASCNGLADAPGGCQYEEEGKGWGGERQPGSRMFWFVERKGVSSMDRGVVGGGGGFGAEKKGLRSNEGRYSSWY